MSAILLNAIPTFLLVFALHFYLKYMFFKPMEKVLQERYAATEGARKLAAEALDRAAARTAEYEEGLRAARSEAYQAQEELHRQLQEREAGQVAAARQAADAAVQEAREQLVRDVEQAKAELAGESDGLAIGIAESVLRGIAA